MDEPVNQAAVNQMYARATFSREERAGEPAWSIRDLPSILQEAESLGLACVGGTFQFRTENHTAEMYWLSTETAPRATSESWPDYCKRAREETSRQVEAIMTSTDFQAEAKNWKPILSQLELEDSNAADYLVFVASFDTPTSCDI